MTSNQQENPLSLATALTENSGAGSIPMIKIMFRTTEEMSAAATQLRALAKAPALETDEPQSQAALVSALTSWAERWAISTTRDDLDKGWSFAAQEVLEMIRKVIPQKAEVIERTNQGDSGCIMTGDTL